MRDALLIVEEISMLTLEDYGKGFSISAIGLGLLMVFATMIKTTPREVVATEDETYAMVRPTDYTGDFDLTGREIDRTIIGGKKAKPVTDAVVAKDDAKAKAAAAKKAADDKKKQANAKKKPGSLQLTNVDTRENGTHFSVDTVDTRNKAQERASSFDAAVAPKNDQTAAPDDNQKGSVKSASEWRAVLHSTPTKSFADEFNAAHARHEVEDSVFYQISLELFSDTAADRHNIGLYILQKDQSLVSFSFLAKAYSKVNETLQKDLWSILLTYASSAKFAGLAAAMNSADLLVVKLATDVLNVAVSNVATATQASRDGRAVAGVSSVASLQIFIPILTRLSASTDQGIVQIANQLLSRIRSFFIA